MAGTLGVGALLLLLAMGVPIGVAMGLVGLVGMSLLIGLEPALIKTSVVLFESVSRYELGVLPRFLLMAHLCFAAGASRDFFAAAASLVPNRLDEVHDGGRNPDESTACPSSRSPQAEPWVR